MERKWQELLEEYLVSLKRKECVELTLVAYRLHLTRFIEQMQLIAPVECTTKAAIQGCQNVIAAFSSSYKGDGSRKLFIASVRAFLNWCSINNTTPKCSIKQREITRNIGTGRHTEAITNQETRQFLKTIRVSDSPRKLRDEVLFSLYAYTGIRRSEPLTMSVFDFDNVKKKSASKVKGGWFDINLFPVEYSLFYMNMYWTLKKYTRWRRALNIGFSPGETVADHSVPDRLIIFLFSGVIRQACERS